MYKFIFQHTVVGIYFIIRKILDASLLIRTIYNVSITYCSKWRVLTFVKGSKIYVHISVIHTFKKVQTIFYKVLLLFGK